MGDLLVCEGGEGGRCGIVGDGSALPDPCIIQNALHRVRPRRQRSVGDASRNDYLQYVLSTVASAGWLNVLTDKATIAHFTAEKFGALLIPIPPVSEQTVIARFLDLADQRIRCCIRANEKLLALLGEQK
ncbi:MAG: restriction endonuclease subunit S, partial [Bryobacterales bacterium]|nr:restriction endonuclease subunit S [Bryobacterales bacterium]